MERWVEEIEGWDERPFSGGYAGLHDLADDSFSGAVSAGSTWLLFVNGRVVSVGEHRQTAAGHEFEPGEPGPDGDIERFEDADGSVHEAPHPGVPLLVAMQLADGETRGRYYTEKTPITEVQATLSDGGFTGYVELSENVLSGDYYTVYQAGRSMDLAFVGNARRLKTDDEALELTRDEVGIYEVVAVDLDVTEIPESAGGSAAGAAGTAGAAGAAGGATAAGSGTGPQPAADNDAGPETDDTATGSPTADAGSPGPTADSDASEAVREPDDEPADAAAEDPLATGTGPRTATGETSEPEAEPEPPTGSDSATESDPEPKPSVGGDDGRSDGAASAAEPAGESSANRTTDRRDWEPSTEPTASDEGRSSSGSTPSGDSATTSPTEQLASRSVPSVDPDRTGTGEGTRAAGGRRDRPTERARTEHAAPNGGAAARQDDSTPGGPSADAGESGELREEVETLRESLRAAEAERDDAREELAALESELEQVTAERNELIDERDALEAEADRLRARVAELEAQVDLPADGPSLTEAEALSGTNLFVRYESKGLTTVEDVHDGDGSPDDLAENLRISAHTQFESEHAHVAGEPFDEWLRTSQQYRFVEWLVSQLVFEVRDTGSAESMRDLYDALPRIDRIEFDATVSVEAEDGDVSFDVVCHDRMGEPLVVADLDADREPVEEAEMAALVKDAIAVCRGEESFAAAFYVTAAFFESPALETARDATSGSLLSRDSRRSYVKESRKRGFHLGLVESRDGAFHLSVPDL